MTLQAFEDLRHAWQQSTVYFIEIVESVPHELRKKTGVCGVWNVQQVIAHLAGWQREALKRYRAIQNGDTANVTYDTDAFNKASVDALSLLNWRETLETYRYTCEDLQLVAQSLTQVDPRHEEWMRELSRENHEHADQIKTWLAEFFNAQ